MGIIKFLHSKLHRKSQISPYTVLPIDVVGHILSFVTLAPKYGHLHSSLQQMYKYHLHKFASQIKNGEYLFDMIEALGILMAEGELWTLERIKCLVHCFPQDEVKCFALEVARANRFFDKLKYDCSIMENFYYQQSFSLERGIPPRIGWINNDTYRLTTNDGYLLPETIIEMHNKSISNRDISIYFRTNIVGIKHPDYKLLEYQGILATQRSPSIKSCAATIGEIIICMARNPENRAYIKDLFRRYRIAKNHELLDLYISL